MKVLCIADHVDPLIYSQSVKTRFGDIDLVVSCGDLPLKYYEFIMTTLNKPLLFVFGNHQLKFFSDFIGAPDSWTLPRTAYPVTGATYIGIKVIRGKGAIVGGLGGSRWYNGGENQYTDAQMLFHILRLIPGLLFNRLFYGRFLDLLVTHAPPFGIHDQPDPCHTGFKTFLWFMKVFKPKYLVHGHIHLYGVEKTRVSKYLSTIVVNAYEHQVIEMD